MPELSAMSKGLGHMEGQTGDTFLFTSESVGEGHPGKKYCTNYNSSSRCYCCKPLTTSVVKQNIWLHIDVSMQLVMTRNL